VAYVLPVKPDGRSEIRWLSSRWPLRRPHLFVLSGDSPVGARLPLSSLPWVPPEPGEVDHGRDPFEPRQALAYPLIKTELDDPLAFLRGQELVRGQAADQMIRTALCVEPGKGGLNASSPPTPTLEDNLSL